MKTDKPWTEWVEVTCPYCGQEDVPIDESACFNCPNCDGITCI